MTQTQSNDGGPAFPVAASDAKNVFGEQDGNNYKPGMSLRDWFAGQALVSVGPVLLERWVYAPRDHEGMQSPLLEMLMDTATENCEDVSETVATMCYDIADYMLSQREKGE